MLLDPLLYGLLLPHLLSCFRKCHTLPHRSTSYINIRDHILTTTAIPTATATVIPSDASLLPAGNLGHKAWGKTRDAGLLVWSLHSRGTLSILTIPHPHPFQYHPAAYWEFSKNVRGHIYFPTSYFFFGGRRVGGGGQRPCRERRNKKTFLLIPSSPPAT